MFALSARFGRKKSDIPSNNFHGKAIDSNHAMTIFQCRELSKRSYRILKGNTLNT